MSVSPAGLGHTIPKTQPFIHLDAVDGIKAGIGAIERSEKRQNVAHAVLHAIETGGQRLGHAGERTVAKSIGVDDELDFVFFMGVPRS